MSEIKELEEVKSKIELAKRKQDMAVLEQIVEPLAEAIEELTETLNGIKNKKPEERKEPDYFDKGLSKQVSDGIDKVALLIQKLKPTLDLSPITAIATAVERQNTSILHAINNLPKQDTKGYEGLVREVMNMVHRNNEWLSKIIQPKDYSEQLTSISRSIDSNKEKENTTYELIIDRAKIGNNGFFPITKVTIIPKK